MSSEDILHLMLLAMRDQFKARVGYKPVYPDYHGLIRVLLEEYQNWERYEHDYREGEHSERALWR